METKEQLAKNDTMNELLNDLQPEELEPRLELQILIDPLAQISNATNNVNCRDGGNCNIKD